MKQLLNKLNAGAMAALMLVAAAIMPASAALAYVPPIVGSGTDNNTRAYCQLQPGGVYKIHTDNASNPIQPVTSALTYIFDYNGTKPELERKIENTYPSGVQEFCTLAIQAESVYSVAAGPCVAGATNTPIHVSLVNTTDKSGSPVTYTVKLDSADATYSYTVSGITVADGLNYTVDFFQELAPGSYAISITATDGRHYFSRVLMLQNVTCRQRLNTQLNLKFL